MKRKHLSFLSDPIDSSSFKLTVFKVNQTEIIDGLIKSQSNWYPVISGIPRILTGELKNNLLKNNIKFYNRYKHKLTRSIKSEWQQQINSIENLDKFLSHQKKTGESFAWEWKNIYMESSYEKNNFLHFLSPFIGEKDLSNKIIVDIGCGSGRFTKWGAKLSAKVVFGTDLGESVEVAYQMTKTLNNVCIVQADIYNMPFNNVFDIAYSIGVLHHLPQPQKGFSLLPKVLKDKGKMLIWVYNRRNNNRAIYFYEPIRAILKYLPKPILLKLCYLPAFGVHLFNYFTTWLNFIEQYEMAKKIPFSYYANFPFNMKLNDAFDVLATPKSNYYYVEEIEKWFKSVKLKDIKSFEHPEAGITSAGKKII